MTEIQTRFCEENRRHNHMLSVCVQALTHWLPLSLTFASSLILSEATLFPSELPLAPKASLHHRLSNMPLGGKGPSVLACLWAQTAVTLTCIVLRWYTRRYIKGKVGADDYVLWVTWVRIYYHVARRLGAAQTDLSPRNPSRLIKDSDPSARICRHIHSLVFLWIWPAQRRPRRL